MEKFYKLDGRYSTEFTLDRSNFQIVIPNKLQYNKYDVFDKIKTSVNVPFCKVCDFSENNAEFYKVYKHIDLPELWVMGYQDHTKLQANMMNTIHNYKADNIDWEQMRMLENTDGLIMMKLLSTEQLNVDKIVEQYTDVEIIVRDRVIIITMQTITNKGIDQSKTLSRVSESINLDDSGIIMNTLDATDVSIAGTFFYPNESINLDIFSDMVMNNPLFSQYLKIDENLKLQKKKIKYIVIF